MKMLGKLINIICLCVCYSFAQAQSIDECIINKITYNVYFTSQLEYVSIYNYRTHADSNSYVYNNIKRDTTPESQILILFEKNLNASSKIIFNRKLTFKRQSLKYCIVKFDVIDEKKITKAFTKQLILKNNKWTILESNDNYEIKYVFDVVPISIFWQFDSSFDNIKYPEINAIKSQAKDGDVLNIFKLYSVLQKNKTQLSKYLEKESLWR